jgi:hypothetical protein
MIRRPDALEALHELLLDLGQALLGHAPAQVERLGAHAAHAHHARRDPGGALDVAAHAVGVLAVEDVLGGHGAERPHEVADVLVAPAREALLLLDRPGGVPSEPPRMRIDSRVERTSFM